MKTVERAYPRLPLILAWATFYAVLLAIAVGFVVTAGGWARAHDALPTSTAPLGWSYPFSCCSGYDCREVTFGPDGMVREDAERDGYVIATTDEFIPQSDTRIKESPDGQFHWCSVAGKNDSKTICLFVPPKAF